MATKRITKQEKVLEYLWNYSKSELEVKDIIRNTALKSYQVHNALKSLKNRGVISVKKQKLYENKMPKNILKIKLKNLGKVRYILFKEDLQK